MREGAKEVRGWSSGKVRWPKRDSLFNAEWRRRGGTGTEARWNFLPSVFIIVKPRIVNEESTLFVAPNQLMGPPVRRR